MYPLFRYLKTWISGIYTNVCYITKRITRLLWYESDTNSVDLIVDDCRHCASFIIIQGRKPVICLGLDIFPQTNDLLQIYYRLSFEPITDLPFQCFYKYSKKWHIPHIFAFTFILFTGALLVRRHVLEIAKKVKLCVFLVVLLVLFIR